MGWKCCTTPLVKHSLTEKAQGCPDNVIIPDMKKTDLII